MGYQVWIFEQKDTDFCSYASAVCSGAKNIYNVGNFLIRNTMTGLHKDFNDMFPTEKEVLERVFSILDYYNELYETELSKSVKDITSDDYEPKMNLSFDLMNAMYFYKEWAIPTKENWFLNYNLIDFILKKENNPDYNYMHKQFIQNALRKLHDSWMSYFKALKVYKVSPELFTGKPKIPKYQKKKEMTAKISGSYLVLKKRGKKTRVYFPNQMINGKKVRGSVLLNNLPEEKIAMAEIQPFHGRYRLILTFGKADKKTKKKHRPENIMGIDPGIDNFAAITDNTGGRPLIIKGKFLKARNQYFNKMYSEYLSLLTIGENSKKSKKNSHYLDYLCRKRKNFFRDCFYKISHRICKIARERNIDTIVIGHNEFWKQEVNLYRINNQNFVMIPFNQFFDILDVVASKYGIVVILQEESYTSKASFLDNDEIPTYKKNDKEKHSFSGKRIKRGLYQSKENILLNADINGSANIIRKFKPDAFTKKGKKFLYDDVITFNFSDFYYTKKVV